MGFKNDFKDKVWERLVQKGVEVTTYYKLLIRHEHMNMCLCLAHAYKPKQINEYILTMILRRIAGPEKRKEAKGGGSGSFTLVIAEWETKSYEEELRARAEEYEI